MTSNTLRDAQKSCIRMISRRGSRFFCELCLQKTPRRMLPINSNLKNQCKICNYTFFLTKDFALIIITTDNYLVTIGNYTMLFFQCQAAFYNKKPGANCCPRSKKVHDQSCLSSLLSYVSQNRAAKDAGSSAAYK